MKAKKCHAFLCAFQNDNLGTDLIAINNKTDEPMGNNWQIKNEEDLFYTYLFFWVIFVIYPILFLWFNYGYR